MAIEHFVYRGERWRRITYKPERNFAVGLDLGQASDPTAIAVIDHQLIPLQEFAENKESRIITQLTREHFDVRHLERLPLNTSYMDIASYTSALMARKPLPEYGAELIVDSTRVGRPVCDILRRAGLRFSAVTITGGDSEIYVKDREYRVPKALLVTGLDARLAVGELRFSDKLAEANAIKNELKDFRRQIGATGHITFNARSGAHDDLILACALALWWLAVRESRGSFGVSILQSQMY